MDSILQLYPLPGREMPLVGAYLAHQLRHYVGESANKSADISAKPFIYANFVTSLDGRIAIPHPSGRGQMVPKTTANERDWRLYQELAAQADLIISSGRYLRDWADGRAQEILQVDDPRFADLREWRENHGLPPQPDIAILSGSLDFPIPPVLTAGGRRVVVFTSANPDLERVKEIEARAGKVFVAGESSVSGASLALLLSELGYHTVYSAAGPRIMHLLIEGGVLNRLYLTFVNRLLGGQPFSTILEGPLLEPAVNLKIHHLYFDPHPFEGVGQLFAGYDRP